MTLSIASIIAFVTLILGQITKKFNLVNSKYLPFQNIIIGIISGLLVYLTGLEPNIYNAIITCLMSAFGAGGIYDTYKKGKEIKSENKS
jgi:hypothetical protein